MSYGNRGISHGMHSNSRPGLLGAGPNSNRRGASLSPQQTSVRRDRVKQGLLGNAPHQYLDDEEMYDRDDSYTDRRDSSYKNTYEEQPYKREAPGGDRYPPLPPPMPNKERIPPKTRRIMENYGLTNSDLKELSQLPEHKLSSSNFIEMIKSMKERKTFSQPRTRQQSFDDRYEQTQHHKGFDSYDGSPRYPEEGRQDDAFSSFQEKWYSETSKKNEREQQMPPSGSILRGSRGPMAKPVRWEREERPDDQHLRRSPPRMMEAQKRRMSPSPQRRSSPVMMSSRRMSSPPIRRMSPPPRRASPPLRRHASPPVKMPKGIAGRGGLLGDPHEPSTQELDMLAASVSRPQGNYRPREFSEPSRNELPARSRTPPPLMAQVVNIKRKEPMPHPRPVPRPDFPRKQAPQPVPPPTDKVKPNSDLSFPKAHAASEANIMRREEGRVLYLRYQAGAMGVIREEHLVKLSQPFEKVTNILLMAPQNLKSGWYQAFIELAHFDGAAAMLEHYMTRPPTVEGVTLMFQRSKHPTLQLRKNQMNRDFDHLLGTKPEPKRRRAMSLSPDRGGKRPLRSRRDSLTKEQEVPKISRKSTSRDRTTHNKKERKPRAKRERKDSSVDRKSDRSHKDLSTERKFDKPEKAKEKEIPVKELSPAKDLKEAQLTNGAMTVASKLKDEKNKERLDIIRDNLDQAITMSEELLPSITEESSKEILSEIMEYLADSTSQLKEIEDTLQ